MVSKKKYWLNEYGERYWYFKSDPTITAHRAYYWVDRIVYIHERTVRKISDDSMFNPGHLTTSDRRCLGSDEFNHPDTYTEFKKEGKLWIPIENYDIYIRNVLLPIYRKRKINQIQNGKD